MCKLHLIQGFPVLSWLSLINIYCLQQFPQQMRTMLVYWLDWANTVLQQSLSLTTFVLLTPLIPDLFSVKGRHYQNGNDKILVVHKPQIFKICK